MKHLAFICALFVGIVVLAWFLTGDGDAKSDVSPHVPAPVTPSPQEPVVPASTAGDEARRLAEGEPRPQPAAPKPAAEATEIVRFTVKSEVGLAVRTVEVLGSDGMWRPCTNVAGQAMYRGALPVRVRIPGHEPGLVREAEETVVVPVESLLILHDPGGSLTGRKEVDIHALRDTPAGFGQVAACGSPDGGPWMLALSSERLQKRGTWELELRIPLATGELLDVELRHQPGMRAEGTLLEEMGRAERAALALQVTSDSQAGLGAWTARIRGERLTSQVLLREATTEKYLGKVHWVPAPFDESLRATGEGATMPGLTLGREYVYFVRDQSTGASAMGRFKHEREQSLRVELRGGCRITGLLSTTDGSNPPQRADFRVYWSEPRSASRWTSSSSEWNTIELEDHPVGADGRFELVSFTDDPSRFPEKAHLNVRVRADGFASAYFDEDVERAEAYDLGTLRIQPRAPDVVLAPGHGVTNPRALFRSMLAFDGKSWHVDDLRERSDGALAIFLREVETDDAARKYDAWNLVHGGQAAHALPTGGVPPRIALQADPWNAAGDVYRFERDSAGLFHPVEIQRYALNLEVYEREDPDVHWRVFLEWEGTRTLFGTIEGAQAGETLSRRIEAPARGVSLRWIPYRVLNAGMSPPQNEGSSVELQRARMTIGIR